MMVPNSTGQHFVPGMEHESAAQVKCLQVALTICKASQNTPSVRDACRFVYDCLKPIMPVNRLFFAVRTETGGVHFLAFEGGNDKYSLPDRELRKVELLAQVFEHGDYLSSKDYEASEELLGPELSKAKSWVLMPLVPSAKQPPGVFGACSDQPNAFSEMDVHLLRTSAEAIMTVMARTSAIDRIVSVERERVMAEAAGDLLHDIANMLGPIPAYADMIKQTLDEAASPVGKRYLQSIRSQAMEVQAACQSKLAEIKSRMTRSKMTRTDVVQLLNSARTASETGQLDVQFRSEIDHSVPHVLVRHREFFEVLKEIIRNGLWAMRKSEKKTLTLRARPWNDPHGGVWAMIEIEDTGCGIPKSDLDKIWELTYSTKSSSGGYGLYRVKSVVEDLGGHISVRSQVNAGTTFEIRLPGEIRPGAGSPIGTGNRSRAT